MTRSEFLKVMVSFAGTAAVGACSSDDDGGGGVCTVNVASNHGHGLTIERADLDAAADKTYSIQGSSGHSHNLTVTAADFTTLATGRPVTTTTSTGATHTHDVTLSACA